MICRPRHAGAHLPALLPGMRAFGVLIALELSNELVVLIPLTPAVAPLQGRLIEERTAISEIQVTSMAGFDWLRADSTQGFLRTLYIALTRLSIHVSRAEVHLQEGVINPLD